MEVQELKELVNSEAENIGKELINRYPWLNAYHFGYLYICGDVDEDYRKEFDGDCLLLDLPKGWVKSFGVDLCEEIKVALEKANISPNDYKIQQIKEKYGAMRLYAVGGNDEIDQIIDKYEDISARTCCNCGKPAKYITKGWITPFCEDCLPKGREVIDV